MCSIWQILIMFFASNLDHLIPLGLVHALQKAVQNARFVFDEVVGLGETLHSALV